MEQAKWFTSKEFEMAYHTQRTLGAVCSDAGTKITLWAPTAEAVFLHFYPTGSQSAPAETVALYPRDQGVWEYDTARNMDGWYYDFDVTVAGVTRRTADPWAKACGINGIRSMVVDLKKTDPDGWEKDAPPAQKPEQIIWETHVRDFSWDPAGGFPQADRGKFSAFCRTGTTLRGEGKFPTGVDHLKQLGVTHIQLMPIYDFGSVDESCPEKSYNWGYDPVNYNIPEGSYSSDPSRGHVRIRELKQAIASLHRNGFRVIMDVVYNHTYSHDSWLWRTVPGYFYRHHADGTLSNGSGCGNDLATERSMCRRYIVDSLLYWAEEYHMDGFRFDLMGLLDQELMETIQNQLDARFGAGEKLIYGEPWRAADTALSRPVVLCDKNSLKTIDPRIGAFCDDTRDAVKGSLMDLQGRGFVNGGGMPHEKLRSCIAGWAGSYGAAQTPAQTINYLSCHDDWTLWDKLVFTLDPRQDFTGRSEAVLKANRLAAAMNFCCQGRIFFLSGEEFGRTKNGVKNSYCSDIRINRLDWARAWENRALVDYYRGLIALRQQLPGLQDKTEAAQDRILWSDSPAWDCGRVCVDNGCGLWPQLLLIFHCGNAPARIPLPQGRWQVLVDGASSFRWQEETFLSQTVTMDGGTALILGSRPAELEA